MPNDEESKNPLDAGQHNHSEAAAEKGDNETSKPDSIENNNQSKSKRPVSEARLRANRQNAKKSTGPRTKDGKQRSSLNATRHSILAQVIHLPKEDMAAYNKFTSDYVVSLAPVGTVEIQLAHACADIQFRLHRIDAAEHNLFALGHEENGDNWDTGHPESHAALTFADTLRRSKDPIATITLYEQRLSRRLLQTLKQLREIQAERRKLEEQQLDEMYAIASLHPNEIPIMEPSQLGFVCSKRDWQFYLKRQLLLNTAQKASDNFPPRINSRQVLRQAA